MLINILKYTRILGTFCLKYSKGLYCVASRWILSICLLLYMADSSWQMNGGFLHELEIAKSFLCANKYRELPISIYT